MDNRLTADQQKLVEGNLGLVVNMCRYFSGLKALTQDEKYSEGCYGLICAARKWEGQGLFSTYATIAIKRQILKGLAKAKIPQELSDDDGSVLDKLPGKEFNHEAKEDYGVALDYMSRLGDRERRALEQHFGLDGREPMTITDIGKSWKITERAASALVNGAINRLRGFYNEQAPTREPELLAA